MPTRRRRRLQLQLRTVYNASNGGTPCCQTSLDPSFKRHCRSSARTSRSRPVLLSALVYHHPKLMDRTFNRGNQANGNQQQALAGAVAAFATALVNTPDHLPENLLARIAQKHASLGIQPEQYQIVHNNLMAAI